MEIDNKTKAAVLREFADNMSEPGVDKSVYELARSEADKLDPPVQPIRPHDGCGGMVVVNSVGLVRPFIPSVDDPMQWKVPLEASKVPAFLCDGTRPKWVKDDDLVLVNGHKRWQRADSWIWLELKHCHFCVLNPVQVQ